MNLDHVQDLPNVFGAPSSISRIYGTMFRSTQTASSKNRHKSFRAMFDRINIDYELAGNLYSGIDLFRDDKEFVRLQINAKPGDRKTAGILQTMRQTNGYVPTAMTATIRMFNDGVKSFRPTAEQLEAFAEIDPTISLDTYCQPFPNFVIELPVSFAERFAFQSPVTPGSIPDEPDEFGFVKHRPLAVILDHHPKVGSLAITIVCDSTACFSYSVILGETDRNVTISDDIQSIIESDIKSAHGYDRSKALELGFSAEVFDEADRIAKTKSHDLHRMVRYIITASVNACLSLMQFGYKENLTPERARLMDLLQKTSKRKDLADKHKMNEEALRKAPRIFSFSQEINIRLAVGSSEACDEQDRKMGTVKPHWRRSHWRTQRFGKALSESKRILIPHTMVCKDRFAGKKSDTSVTYIPPEKGDADQAQY